MTPQSQLAKHRYRRWILLLGVLISAAGFGTELVSLSHGLGPYQIWIIVVGLLIVLLGLAKPDTTFFSIIMVLLSFVISLLPVELAAKAYLKFNPAESLRWRDYMIADDTLLFRMKPNGYDHDAHGWRNPAVLEQASIVAIGDSQTWGMNARRDEAWPLALQEITGASVYSLALPGYGPADYYTLFNQEALQLAPEQVVVSLYFGNDLVDAASRVYQKNGYNQWRSETMNVDALLRSKDDLVAIADEGQEVWHVPKPKEPAWFAAFKSTSIGQLLARANLTPDFSTGPALRDVYNALAPDDPNLLNAYFTDTQDLYFDPLRRLIAMDPTQLVVQEGNRLTHIFFEAMQSTAEADGIQLVVVLTPTKELVYANLVEAQHGELSADYTRLIELETALRTDYTAFLTQQGISVIDGLVPLRQAAEAGERIYLPVDGHPIAAGYRALAQYVAQESPQIASGN